MSTVETKETSWFKIIMGSALGFIIAQLIMMLFACLCYLIIILLFVVSVGSTTTVNSINTTPLNTFVK